MRQMNLPLSDLGRHIQNGKVILESKQVFNTNFYSYTFPDFPVLNHHWFFGVLAYTVFTKVGFEGIVLISACIHTLAIGILLLHTKRLTSSATTLLAACLTLPLTSYRTEFRPEIISFLFIICTYVLISSLVRNQTPLWKILLVLIPIQMIWVNTHIFFIMSLGIVGVFGIQALIQKNINNLKKLFFLGFILTIASFCSPYPVAGFLEPLQIFREYGYNVAENQSVWFLSVVLYDVVYSYVYLLTIILCFSLFVCIKNWKRLNRYLPEMLLSALFLAAGFKMVRLLSIAGIFLLPIISIMLHTYWATLNKYYEKITQKPTTLLIGSTITTAVVVLMLGSRLFIPYKVFGIGLMENNNASANFFKEQKLTGPIFNNYDIGGYLIYHLYPNERVFVDNRPEAYPSSFFKETYIPMQESEEKWQEQLQIHNFNVIYFFRKDLTGWAQTFLINRINDENWVPIYVDDMTIILIKNTEKNQAVIDKYRLPKEIFSVSDN